MDCPEYKQELIILASFEDIHALFHENILIRIFFENRVFASWACQPSGLGIYDTFLFFSTHYKP